MFQRLEELVKRYEQLGRMLADPRVFGNHQELQRYAREHSELEELGENFRRYQKINLNSTFPYKARLVTEPLFL